jgi:hypothetical protein
MLSEVVLEPPCGGSCPVQAKGLSVSSGRHSRHTVWTLSQGYGGNRTGRRAGGITKHAGVYMSERLSFRMVGKVLRGERLLLPTGLGKADCPG